MNQCPVHQNRVRPDLPPLTERIAALPVDERGYPVPFFVAYVDGKPDFRVSDGAKLLLCVRYRLCWTCGQELGAHLAFPLGPMCTVTRTAPEPPEHRECALWSVRGCPFLSRPQMKRREDELTESCEANVPGVMIKRNPGVIAVWTTRSFEKFGDGRGGLLFKVGDPVHVTWWREGRAATRAEVLESIESGLPLLRATCMDAKGNVDAEASASLDNAVEIARRYLPI